MTFRKYSAVDVDGVRHRMMTGWKTACGTVMLDRLLEADGTSSGLDEGDHAITCFGCIVLKDGAQAPTCDCYDCQGRGEICVNGVEWRTCPTCDGKGRIYDENEELSRQLRDTLAHVDRWNVGKGKK